MLNFTSILSIMNAIQVKKQHHLSGHKDSLYALCKYSDTHFLSAGGDGMVVLWDLEAPEVGKMIVKVPNSIYSLAYNSAKEILVVGQNFSGIHLVDVVSKKEIGSLALTSSQIFDSQTTDEAIYLATGDGSVIKVSWDLKILSTIKPSDKSARTIAVNNDRKEIAIGFSDQFIRIYDLDLNLKREFVAHDISVFSLQYHPELPLLMSASRDAKIKIWDLDHDYFELEKISAHMYTINHLAFSPDGAYFASCSMDKSVKIWDSKRFRLLKVIDKARHAGHATSVNKLLWMNYRDWLVSCSDDRTISIWEVQMEH
ncbi:MAG: WD40 repeat protein [Marinoscillum sp.]|jgi:WD40 repeat protein